MTPEPKAETHLRVEEHKEIAPTLERVGAIRHQPAEGEASADADIVASEVLAHLDDIADELLPPDKDAEVDPVVGIEDAS